MQVSPEDIQDTETAATLSKVIDELREKLREASPEIKAKREADAGKLQVWPDKLEADASESLRSMQARLEDLKGTETAAAPFQGHR